MLAARLYGPGDLRVEECPVGLPGHDEVLIQVSACGICGSDIPRITTVGTYKHPTTLGHEFMGKVVAVGQSISGEIIGRRAAVIPLIGCGRCDMCLSSLPFHCNQYSFLGSRCDGGFAEFVVAPAKNLVFLEDNVSDLEGALMEPAAVGLHAIRRAQTQPGDTVVIFGAGAIGLFVAQWARLCGASRVIQVDIREKSLMLAKACGADEVINSSVEDPVERVLSLTSGRGADLAVEAAGNPLSTAQVFRCVRRRGRISLIGRIDDNWTMPADVLTGLLRKEQTVYGNWGFDVHPFPKDDWQVAAEMFRQRKLNVMPMITHLFRLTEIHEAISLMTSSKNYFCKVMIVMVDDLLRRNQTQ